MSPRLSSLTAVIGSLLFLATTGVHGTNITCLPEYAWMNNGLGQNPCDIATAAQNACGGGDWNTGPLPPPAEAAGYFYPGPNSYSRSTCMCSTVLYSLFSACGVCQNGTYTTWTGWISNCSTVVISIRSFPAPIPSNTSFPAWAYLSVTDNNNFDVQAAEAEEYLPEFTPVPTSTSDLTSTSTSTVTLTITPISSAAVSKKSSDAGVIAGAVVGGFAAAALLAGLALFFFIAIAGRSGARFARFRPRAQQHSRHASNL
ncbi:hypothetical protein FIBSPDRAFT_563199 [Athelia psychrophila]|uniref:Uncharacterized protein n=1 Tax=Athelia psychrophila TaxID=1759441 RepID=A0A166I4A3_9AGAM|nr:hypothetical protein FIBSPDRAFT_563199 [Fibularhizoctonia sp. CBS 109695]